MKTKRRFLIAGLAIGGLFMVGPVIGGLGTFFGMNRAFKTLGSLGIALKVVSKHFDMTLAFPVAGFVLIVLGAILFTVSLIYYVRLFAPAPPPLPREPNREPRDA